MRLVDLCIRRPVTTVMAFAFLTVLGLLAYRSLPVDVYPNVEIPVVSVTTVLPGAGVEEMETRVTQPLEEAINAIEGIDELRSETREGLSRILVFFDLERSPDAAAQDIRDKVAAALARLPAGVETPVVEKFQMDAVPVLTIVVSAPRDLRELTEIARRSIKEEIETVRGVGSVTLVGGVERAARVTVDAEALFARGIPVEQVRAALAAQNAEIPGGRVEASDRERTLRTLGRVERVSDFARLVVGTVGGRPVALADIGDVEDGIVEPRTRARLDGRPAVALVLRKQSGANTVEVIHRVKHRLDEILPALPPDVSVEPARDSSRFIEQSFREVRFHLLLAGVLVSSTVLLFLADWRATLIAGVAIPISIIATFAVMKLMGFGLNSLTMLGLVLATGIVIDDAVVVLENTFRHMEEEGIAAREAAGRATREIALAVTATTFSLVVIFLPVAFMEGTVGRFFHSYGVTIAAAILFSLIVSFTLTPMLCARFLTAGARRPSRQRGFHAALDRAYGAILRWSLQHRWVIVALALLVMASTAVFPRIMGVNWVPADDQGEFEVIIQTPPGSTLEVTDAALKRIEERLRELPGVRHILATVGDTSATLRAGEGPVTDGALYVRLEPLESRRLSQFELMRRARDILQDFPELRSSVQRINLFAAGRRHNDFEVNITGPDLTGLASYADRIVERMRATPGFVDADTTLSARQPELHAVIAREKAADLGVEVSAIAAALRTLVGGEPVGTFQEGSDVFDVWLRAEAADRDGAEALAALPIATRHAGLVPLAAVATLHEARGPARIDHYNRRRKVTVVANLDGLSLSEARRLVERFVTELDLPPAYRAEFTGEARSLEETGRNMLLAFGLSLLFMYMILAAQFESFVQPITILLALPLSIPFALLSLWLLGEPLNLYSIFGLFMLFGIVKKNGILQVDYTNVLRARGRPRDEAILEANHVRLRPILMTTVMLIAGMLPIALGEGPGSARRAAMAKVIVGGQALCLLLTLLVTPVAYSLFDDLGQVWARVRLRRRPAWREERSRA